MAYFRILFQELLGLYKVHASYFPFLSRRTFIVIYSSGFQALSDSRSGLTYRTFCTASAYNLSVCSGGEPCGLYKVAGHSIYLPFVLLPVPFASTLASYDPRAHGTRSAYPFGRRRVDTRDHGVAVAQSSAAHGCDATLLKTGGWRTLVRGPRPRQLRPLGSGTLESVRLPRAISARTDEKFPL